MLICGVKNTYLSAVNYVVSLLCKREIKYFVFQFVVFVGMVIFFDFVRKCEDFIYLRDLFSCGFFC